MAITAATAASLFNVIMSLSVRSLGRHVSG
jgi:hypothetical protein